MPLAAVLVEDNQTIRENLTPALSELAQAEVLAIAETASDAIEVLRALGDRLHLAVVDLFLREGSGIAVLRAFQDRPRSQRMVVLTNYPTPEIRSRCLGAGADAVFDKSAELDEFFEWSKGLRTPPPAK